MFDFHADKQRYFDIQYKVSKEFIVPFVKNHMDISGQLHVLEIGCAEAGVLKAFTELGHICTGIELSADRVEWAKKFMKEELDAGKINFIARDIYKIDAENELPHKFDLIILKDVIEHIHNQELFMAELKKFLVPNGKVFFAFPPWYMPFGGHQQMCDSKLLSRLPYFHILPRFLYKLMLRLFGENKNKITGLLEIWDTAISIERFERITNTNKYRILKRKLYLTNPIYKYKFGAEPRMQFGFISALPFVRNFLTTCAYYIIKKED